MGYELERTIKIDLKRLTAETKIEIEEAMGTIGALIEGDAKRLCPVDQGTLRASIHYKMEKWNVLRVGTSQITYAAAVEFGTMPHTPPFEPIREWAKRHKIEDAAWAIWQNIREHGTPSQPYLRPAIHNNNAVIARLLAAAMRKATKRAK